MNRVPLPTMISMKKLMMERKELEKSQGKGVTAELLPLMLFFFMHLPLLRHWTYVPDHPVLHFVN